MNEIRTKIKEWGHALRSGEFIGIAEEIEVNKIIAFYYYIVFVLNNYFYRLIYFSECCHF